MYPAQRPHAIVATFCLAVMALAVPSMAAAQQPAASADTSAANQPWLGQSAPDVDLVTTGGERVSLSDFRGKEILVLHFAASW